MNTLKERLNAALAIEASILIEASDLFKPDFSHPGYSTTYLEHLGLRKSDLKKLEHKGFAVRTYTKNMWIMGETLPNGKVVKEGENYRGKGHRVRWLLLTPASIPTPGDTTNG